MKPADITIIGLGNVGTVLLDELSGLGYTIKSVVNPTSPEQYVLDGYPGISFHNDLVDSSFNLGKWVFLTVPDDEIASVCKQVCEKEDDLSQHRFIHCSGLHGSDILKAARNKGALAASFHPLKPVKKSSSSFQGIYFDIEGDEALLTGLEKLSSELGAQSFRIKAEAKPFLHAAAVMASNYLVALAEVAGRIAESGDISKETAIHALLPLMRQTLNNIEGLGPEEALTGPVSRGDVQTVKGHLEKLEENPQILSLYQQMGRIALELAEEKKTLNSKQSALLRDLFT